MARSSVRPSFDQLFPAGFHLADLSHVSHGAAGIEVGQYYLLAGLRQNVSAFGHEMHATENDVFGAGARSFLRQFVGITAKVGKAYDFIALVMMTQNDHTITECMFRGGNARVHGFIRKYKIVFKRAANRLLVDRSH